VLATPLQLAVMTARLATGRAILPNLTRAVDGIEQARPAAPSLGLDPAHLAVIRRAMSEVVNDRRGTAYSSRVVEPAYRLAGKTGTSQVYSITPAERAAGIRTDAQRPWNRRNHALYVAFAPEDAPRIAVSVVVEHGGGGSSVAAPIARDIALFALHGGMPPLSAYPQPQRNRIETMQREMQEVLLPTEVSQG
jgi:penicillin-binding protein 2